MIFEDNEYNLVPIIFDEMNSGFATLPNQVHAEAVELGFALNILVVGVAVCVRLSQARGVWLGKVHAFECSFYN